MGTIQEAAGTSKLWARKKIAQVMHNERQGTVKHDEAKSHIVKVAMRHQLVSRYTSLLAVDEQQARPLGTWLRPHHLSTDLPAGWELKPLLKEGVKTNWMVKHEGMPANQLMAAVPRPTHVALSLSQGATDARQHVVLGLLFLGAFSLLAFLYHRQSHPRVAGVNAKPNRRLMLRKGDVAARQTAPWSRHDR